MKFLPPANEVLGNVIFLHLSVNLFTGWEYLGRYTPWAGTPSWEGTPPWQVHPWAGTPPAGTPPPPMVNARAVRILLECILVIC